MTPEEEKGAHGQRATMKVRMKDGSGEVSINVEDFDEAVHESGEAKKSAKKSDK